MKKKILFVIDSLNCGGAEKSLISVLSVLPRDKFEISLWLIRHVGAFLSLVPKDVYFVTPPKTGFFRSCCLKLGGLLYSIAWRVDRWLGRNTYLAELLWKYKARWDTIPIGDWDIVVAYQQGIPTFIVADKFSNCKKCAWINADIFGEINKEMNSSFYSKMDKIVLVSDAILQKAKNEFPQLTHKMAVVYDMLDINEIRRLAYEPAKSLRSTNDELIFVTTGRLVTEKGHNIAIETAAELKRRGLKFRWYFIGEGPLREEIERMKIEKGVDNEIVLLGLQTNPYTFVNQADVYVQTSILEGFCLTVREAKLLSKPVVSTNFPAIYNQLNHEVNGLIAEMNYMSVADNICRVVSDESLKKLIIENLQLENLQKTQDDVSIIEKVIC